MKKIGKAFRDNQLKLLAYTVIAGYSGQAFSADNGQDSTKEQTMVVTTASSSQGQDDASNIVAHNATATSAAASRCFAARTGATAAAPFRSLALKEVCYQYQGEDGERFILGPLNLRLTPGELVFVVGGNGSGKTTLANLLVGLYPPDSGVIQLNDHIVETDQQESYRQLFSVVFSDFFLFDDVAFVHERTPEQVNHLLQLLKLSHKVHFQNGRFSTTALSQGQRKRLALLQAWLEERPVYLFDEWAADQDPEFKAVFYLELLPMLKTEGKTIVAITHDDRYFHLADRIIKLESGQIV